MNSGDSRRDTLPRELSLVTVDRSTLTQHHVAQFSKAEAKMWRLCGQELGAVLPAHCMRFHALVLAAIGLPAPFSDAEFRSSLVRDTRGFDPL